MGPRAVTQLFRVGKTGDAHRAMLAVCHADSRCARSIGCRHRACLTAAAVFAAVRLAVDTVCFVALFAVFAVLVAARRALVAVAPAARLAEVIVPLVPADAARAVLVAPLLVLLAVSWTPAVAVAAALRNDVAFVRAAVEPVGEVFGFFV